ncbi:uncharacterized protein LOC124839305 [Vigna umbellata]|uniref:uncharacterized protein LOC124839305 n=1 Tax=Vigna umbellata TaxID=87088 RepID=UPI001F5FF474|nr:uncharacterized protein LOC124839305 [Vigna umbellata]
MVDLDLRTNTDDRMEPMGETRPFNLGPKEEQVTTIGSELEEDQARSTGAKLKKNKDLFAWIAADMPRIHPKIMPHKLAHCERAVENVYGLYGSQQSLAQGFLLATKYRCVGGWGFGVPSVKIPGCNAGATYQRLMDRVFSSQIGRCMEVYVDDMVVRSRSVEEHVKDLAEVFYQVRKYNMRLNPAKCTFWVPTGKFLGFVLTTRGIEANPDKCRTILEMRSPQKLKEVQRLVGRLTSLSRFIPKLAERIKLIVRIMKKSAGTDWDDQCEQAFNKVKSILVTPPVMGRPKSGHALQLFLAISEDTVRSALVQEQPEFRLVYFVSRTLQPTETRYKRVEKIALALLMAPRRLRPYFQSHQVIMSTDHPIAKILRKPDLVGRIVGWSVELSEFGLQFEPRGSVRGQHLADFAVELPWEAKCPWAWTLYVDGSSERSGGVAGIVLEGPDDFVVEQTIVFRLKISNNQAEYEAVIAGLELAKDLGAVSVKCRTDSQLVVGQLNESFQTKDDQLLRYYHKVKELVKQFWTVEFKHMPREQNVRADVLSKLTNCKGKDHLSSVIRNYSEVGEWLVHPGGRGQESRSVLTDRGDLYKRGFSLPLLKCVAAEEAEYVMKELHEGACGMHTWQQALRAKVIRAGYFWPTVEKDYKEFVQKCLKCREHGRNLKLPPVELHSLMSPWSFAQWGIDIVGPFPMGRAQKKFLLVAIDYFTKWVEVEPLAIITAMRVQKLAWTLICRFGIPKTIVTDNGRQFVDKGLGDFYKKLGVKHVMSSVEHPQTNGQVEAANKVIVAELKKRYGDAKGAWVDELQEVLWGYRCTPHGTTGETPFNLTYGMDAMLPVEVGEPTIRRGI